MTHALVVAKSPVAGRVKTRLCPPFTLEEAAALAEAALADTLASVASCSADRKIIALDGPPGDWLPPGFEIIAQRGSGLAERLANAWVDAAGAGIQIGMDTPQVEVAELDTLLATIAIGGPSAVLGHAADGGWWVIGFGAADPTRVFRGIPMSTPITGARQERRMRQLGLHVSLGSVHRDIDTASDLCDVASLIPHSRTSAVVRSFGLQERLAS